MLMHHAPYIIAVSTFITLLRSPSIILQSTYPCMPGFHTDWPRHARTPISPSITPTARWCLWLARMCGDLKLMGLISSQEAWAAGTTVAYLVLVRSSAGMGLLACLVAMMSL
ncbi:hypothetical protein BJX64DRAFT_266305 [Aspergillus heterothallicus]